LFNQIYSNPSDKITMITTIALILFGLVAFNFLLLIFSCNKNTKSKPKLEKPTLSRVQKSKETAKTIASTQLAATGS